MTQPTEQIAAWNQAAYDAAMNYARASLASAEQLLHAEPRNRPRDARPGQPKRRAN